MMTTSNLSEAEALQQSGQLFRHKRNGIYRLLEITSMRRRDIIWAGNEDYKKSDMLATYEHLWPHPHQEYQRPYAEFSQPERFARIVRLQG